MDLNEMFNGNNPLNNQESEEVKEKEDNNGISV